MFESISKNKTKTFFIMAFITAFVGAAVYFISYAMGYPQYALVFALIFSIGSTWGSYYFSDKIILSISGARPADARSDKMVRDAMEGLCIAAGLPMPKVYIIPDDAANAFATGRNPKNAVVCVTTGLLQQMDYYELEGVLAHELAHIGNRDILLSTIATTMVGLVVILSDIFTRSLFWGGGRRRSSNNDKGGGAQAILMIIGLVFLILAPIAGQMLKMALSRNREYLADATAVQFTRNPTGLADALAKLGAQSAPVMRASKATENLYIVNPLKAAKGGGMMGLFSTHPPIEKRIEALKNMR